VLTSTVLAATQTASSTQHHPDLESLVQQLVTLARKLPREDEVEKSGWVGVSFDGAAELRPQSG
jgi:hypothetical protein